MYLCKLSPAILFELKYANSLHYEVHKYVFSVKLCGLYIELSFGNFFSKTQAKNTRFRQKPQIGRKNKHEISTWILG